MTFDIIWYNIDILRVFKVFSSVTSFIWTHNYFVIYLEAHVNCSRQYKEHWAWKTPGRSRHLSWGITGPRRVGVEEVGSFPTPALIKPAAWTTSVMTFADVRGIRAIRY